MADEATGTSSPDPGGFPPTSWSEVLAAGRGDDTASRRALTRLCQTYWYPLYAFVRRHGRKPEDAQDLTQDFFAHLLEHHALAKADPSRGRFRAFLLSSLRHYLANEWDRTCTQKRGGGHAPIPLDALSAETRYGLEPANQASPDKVFDRAWALAVLEQVLKRLRQEQATAGKGAQFEQLSACLMADPDAPRYEALAARLGARAPALRMAVSRMRQRYRELLREEIAQTVSNPAEIGEEMRHLLAALGE